MSNNWDPYRPPTPEPIEPVETAQTPPLWYFPAGLAAVGVVLAGIYYTLPYYRRPGARDTYYRIQKTEPARAEEWRRGWEQLNNGVPLLP